MMLVLLRITLGWHFLYAGLWKYNNPDFSSQGFLTQAKGPLSDHYYALINDFDGRERLNTDKNLAALKEYANRFVSHYGVSDEQKKIVDRVLSRRSAQLKEYLDDNKDDISLHWKQLENLAAEKQSPLDTPYQRKRLWDKQTELRKAGKVWTDEVDRIWEEFKLDTYDVLKDDQKSKGPMLAPKTQMEKVDKLVTFTNIAIGACLMAGLFTRLSALGGGLFLLSIVLASPDWPGMYPKPPPSSGENMIVTKEFVEMMALFAIAAMPVGRWGGLDYFVHHLLVRPVYRKRKA